MARLSEALKWAERNRRGRCPQCGFSFRLRLDGKVGAHRLYQGMGMPPVQCAGGGQEPK